MGDKELELKITENSLAGMLLVLVCAAFFFAFASVLFSTPIAFGDEGFHAGMPKLIAGSVEIPAYFNATKIYAGAYFRPPLPHLIPAGAIFLLGNAEFFTKILTALFPVLTALFLFLFVKRTYSPRAALLTSFIYLTVPAVITYGVLVYSEGALLFSFAAFLYGYSRFLEERSVKMAVFTGVAAGFVALSKITGVVMLPLVVLLFLLERKDKKLFGVILLIASAILLSTLARQAVLYGGVCQPRLPADNMCYVGEAAPDVIFKDEKAAGETYLAQTGINLDMVRFGLINYANFSYGLVQFALAVCGFLLLAFSQDRQNNRILAAFLLVFMSILSMSYTGRAEDASRALLLATPFFAVFAGKYAEGVTRLFGGDYAKKIAVAAFVLLVVFALSASAVQKVGSMKDVKGFVPEYLEACKWMDENLPPGTYVVNLYGTPCQYYAPSIRSVWTDMLELKDILYSKDDSRVRRYLERNGIGYFVIPKFAIQPRRITTAIPLEFAEYAASSSVFSNVYENPQTIIYKVV